MISPRIFITLFAILLIILDSFFAFYSYRKHVREGYYLCQTALLTALVTFSYLLSILEMDYFRASVMASIYFISIDWLLLTMIKLTTAVTTQGRKWKKKKLMHVLDTYAVFDTIVLLINPFKEIAISYAKNESIIACYDYQMKPLYYAHLAFTYLLVTGVLGILISKIHRTPRQYRNQYRFIADIIILIVIVNAFFLIPQIKLMYYSLDISIAGYSIGLMAIYWSSFEYRNRYLQYGLSSMIMDNLNQGVLLFDYDGYLVMKNAKAEEMLPFMHEYEVNRGHLHVRNFLQLCGIPIEKDDIGSQYSIQLFSDSGIIAIDQHQNRHEGVPMRCDYQRMEDSHKKRVGDLFVFTSSLEEIDVLTEYHSWEYFRKYVGRNTSSFSHPCAVASFDINGLSFLNRKSGKEAGDALIRKLSETIRRYMPEESYYIRGYDAQLIVISYFTDESAMKSCGEQVVRQFQGTLTVGYSASDSEETDILALIREADQSMQYKKLLDKNSTRSHTMSSLVRALKESDSDTEAHVKRTQNMGRMLGQRFDLTDLAQSQLALLCLLHDIGKVGVPLEILNKPGKLTDEEWAVLKTHTEKGYQIAISSWELKDIADMILYHHERWDGNGYPKGLAREEIPFLSRIISVVDSFDAMVSNRSYRKGMSTEAAKAEIKRCSGTQFDPNIASEFLKMLEMEPELFEDMEERAAAKVTNVDASHSEDTNFAPVSTQITPEDLLYNNWKQPEDFALNLLNIGIDSVTGQEQIRYHIPAHPVIFSRYEMNLDDYILSADENFIRFTGYGPEDISSRRLRQRNLIPEEDRETYFSEVDKQLEKGNLVYMEHYILRKDGNRIYVFCYARKFYHSASKSLRIEVIIVDIARTSLVHKTE